MYQLKADKPYTVFIRNLHHTTDISSIKHALAEFGFNATNIIKVQIKKKVNDRVTFIKLPLFKIDLAPCEENKDILKLSSILNYRITVELPRKTSTIAQCKRCQGIRHSHNYCNKTPRCVKCGDKHPSSDCSKPKDVLPKCGNCYGQHTANFCGCPAFKNKANLYPKLSAVDRIKIQPTPAMNTVSDTSPSFSAIVGQPRLPIPPVSKPIPQNDSNKILEALSRIEKNQSKFEQSLKDLESRIANLESTSNPASPRAKKRRKR